MSLLSRLRGSKGYGACRDGGRPRADQPSEARAMEREYLKSEPATQARFWPKKGGPCSGPPVQGFGAGSTPWDKDMSRALRIRGPIG